MADRELEQAHLEPLVDGGKAGLVGQQRHVGPVDQREVAVEVCAGGEVEAALLFGELILRTADGVSLMARR